MRRLLLLLAIPLLGCGTASSVMPDVDEWDQQAPVPLNEARHCASLAPPMMRKPVPPEYDATLRRNGVQGNVLLTVVVNANGEATSAEVTSSPSPELARSCVAAVLAQLYSPAVCDGQPVSVSWQLSCRFKLHPS